MFPHDDSQKRSADEAIAWARDALLALGARPDDAMRRRPSEPAKESANAAGAIPAGATQSASAADVDRSVNASIGDIVGQATAAHGAKTGGHARAVSSTDSALPTWWEGREIKTLIVPMPEEGFAPDVSENSFPTARNGEAP